MQHLVVNGEPLMNDLLAQKRQIKLAMTSVILTVLSITLAVMVEVVVTMKIKKHF